MVAPPAPPPPTTRTFTAVTVGSAVKFPLPEVYEVISVEEGIVVVLSLV